MNKWYFGFPLLMLLVFGGVFWQFDRSYEARKERLAAEEREQQAIQLRQQMEERLKAAQEAKRISDENRRIRAEERAREEKEKQERADAIVRRDQAAADLGKARRVLDDVRGNLGIEEDRLKKLTDENAFLAAEKKFLTEYVQRAEKNASRMLGLVQKVDEAAAKITAEIEAAKAAATAPKK